MKYNWFYFLIFSLLLGACSDFNKVVKSTDYEYKYKKAIEYYETGDHAHATALFQDLVYVFRGTTKGDDLFYYYAKSAYEMKDYTLAAHFFKSIYEQYPRSEYVDEAYFMVGLCNYNESPKAKLDQSLSLKAIDALQLFINLYPYSERVEEASLLIDELNEKLVYKSYLSAKLYHDMGYYKAAVVALDNSLNDFPDTKFREELKYLLFKSKYLLGINSVEEKKRDRLNATRDEYFTFVDEFPESKYFREVERNYNQVNDLLGIDN